MTKFIALRRMPRAAAMGLSDLSMDGKRSAIVKEAPQAEQSRQLERIGLSKVAAEQRAPDEGDKYQSLSYVGAYVVETTDEATAHAAQQVLEPEYHIMPDIEMGLPYAMLARRYERRPRRKQYWPDESGVAQAHAEGITGKGVLVGVLDTGCDADHLELRDKEIEFRYVPLRPTPEAVRAVRGFDTNGHGTQVTSIIAGKNVGIAPDVDLMVASVIESETVKTSLERVVIALDWMLSQFQREEYLGKSTIINLSIGFRPEWISATQLRSVVDGVQLIIETLAVDFDVLPVVAIGNDGPGIVRAPGYFAEPMSVGAVDANLQPAWFSGSGVSPVTHEPEPDITGYGIDVLSAIERNAKGHSLYALNSGTSMAAPYVTGIAALVAQKNPGLQGLALKQHLLDHALPLPDAGSRAGAGLARVC
ncbi:MAG: S8 family serine peptidase [Anaerolineae bacterium]|nr:S8 family serine peptidase [Anaerolineae bacterium]